MKIKYEPMVVLLACILCACSNKASDEDGRHSSDSETTSQTASTNRTNLIKEIEAANNDCRDLPGLSKEGVKACDKRDQLLIKAKEVDLCWGPQEAIGADKHWMKCSDDPAYVKPWFSHDLNHAKCIASESPAAKMRSIMDSGKKPKVVDLPNGSVEVQDDFRNGKTVVWTFYSSMDLCTRSLPRSKIIEKKYE